MGYGSNKTGGKPATKTTLNSFSVSNSTFRVGSTHKGAEILRIAQKTVGKKSTTSVVVSYKGKNVPMSTKDFYKRFGA